jgi:hypothetical protein
MKSLSLLPGKQAERQSKAEASRENPNPALAPGCNRHSQTCTDASIDTQRLRFARRTQNLALLPG